jgi:hypothetical protein
VSPAKPHRDYSGTPLPKKLGLVTAKGGVGEVAVVGAPEGFRALLGELPEDVRLHARLRDTTRLALCFVRSRTELEAMLEMLTAQLPRAAHVWVIRPKTHLEPDLKENDVREGGLAVGLVDFKVCSVSEEWSGLKFAWRKTSP